MEERKRDLKGATSEKSEEDERRRDIKGAGRVVMTLKERAKAKFPTVTRGGLPGTYKFAQLHFHWGASSDKGSEHKIN